MSEQKVSRRDFIKTTGLGATATAAVLGTTQQASAAALLDVDRAAIVSAIGDTLIPSDPGDPGYRTLEPYNITAEVLKELDVSDEDLALFNSQTQALFSGKAFVQLGDTERTSYFDSVFGGTKFEKETGQKLQRVVRRVRQRVFQVFYSNYPEHALPRDSKGVPMLPAGDTHQITNPNSGALVTGWDIAGFMGPLTWAEEERRREFVKKIDWKE